MQLHKQLQRLIRLAVSTVGVVSTGVCPLLNAQTPAMAAETAKSADSLVDSMCVVTHWRYPDTPYGYNYDNVKQKLIDLGLRHIRDGGSSEDVVAKLKQLAIAGIKTTYVEAANDGVVPNASYWVNSPGYNIHDFVLNTVGTNVIDAVEMLNEPDIFYNYIYWHPGDSNTLNNDPNSPLYWRPYTESITKDTWTALKSDPQTAGVKVIGPALGSAAPSPLGDLSSSVDWGNFHPYPGGGNGLSFPFSYDTINSYYWNANFPSNNIDEWPTAFNTWAGPFGGKPMVATETGYNTSTAPKGISEQMQGKYMPRLFLEYFRLGIARTCSYELVDEWNDRSNPDANFGLLRNDLTPKPAYTALQNLIALLKDPGSSFTPGSLDYTLSVAPPAGYYRTQYVHHLLLQKQDGTFYLALWHEISNGDVSSTPVREITPPAMPTTVTFNQPIARTSVWRLDDSGNMSSAVTAISNNTLQVNVTDKVMVLKIKPS